MNAVAIIPARGGSKGIPRKNVRPLCGKPLIAWTIEAAKRAKSVGRVVVSTDDAEIADVSRQYGAEVVWRPQEISGDTSASELALLHALDRLGIRRGAMAFLQCTAPLILPQDIDATLGMLKNADSSFTGSHWHRFVWKAALGGVIPVGHSKGHRPMRQQLEPTFLEVGAVYATWVETFVAAQTRFAGNTAIYPIPADRSLEIDDEVDFLLVETLLRQRLRDDQAAQLPVTLRAVVLDFDGVMTDNRVQMSQTGEESIVCHRGDGWAIGRLRALGLSVVVLTQETNPAVKRRCEKLGVECMVAQDKLPALRAWLEREQIAPNAAVYVGNDEPDIPCLLYVGCGVVPADAYAGAKVAAQIILDTPGGHGCVRELASLIMSRRTAGNPGR